MKGCLMLRSSSLLVVFAATDNPLRLRRTAAAEQRP